MVVLSEVYSKLKDVELDLISILILWDVGLVLVEGL
jgi:hypothetical protein